MDYIMLFLDLDNTLLSNDLSISDENLKAIRAASEKGVKVVICTGRGVFSVKGIAEQFGINWDNCYIICLNGGAVYKGFPPVLIKAVSYTHLDVYKRQPDIMGTVLLSRG